MLAPDIADDDRPVKGRQHHGNARPAYAGQRSHAQLGCRDAGAGVSGRDDDIHLALGGHLAHHRDRAVGLVADRLDRRIVHLHDLRGVNDLIESLVLRGKPLESRPSRMMV